MTSVVRVAITRFGVVRHPIPPFCGKLRGQGQGVLAKPMVTDQTFKGLAQMQPVNALGILTLLRQQERMLPFAHQRGMRRQVRYRVAGVTVKRRWCGRPKCGPMATRGAPNVTSSTVFR